MGGTKTDQTSIDFAEKLMYAQTDHLFLTFFSTLLGGEGSCRNGIFAIIFVAIINTAPALAEF